MLVEGRIEAGLVEIERIGVLHREFAHSEQAALGSGLVTELGVHLVPDLRKRLVGGDFLGEVGEHLLLGHAEAFSAPLRSVTRNISSPMTSQRPDFFQREAGCIVGSWNS